MQLADGPHLVGMQLCLAVKVPVTSSNQQRVLTPVEHVVGTGQHQLRVDEGAAADEVAFHVHQRHHPGELGEDGLAIVVAIQLVVEPLRVAIAASLQQKILYVTLDRIATLLYLEKMYI